MSVRISDCIQEALRVATDQLISNLEGYFKKDIYLEMNFSDKIYPNSEMFELWIIRDNEEYIIPLPDLKISDVDYATEIVLECISQSKDFAKIKFLLSKELLD